MSLSLVFTAMMATAYASAIPQIVAQPPSEYCPVVDTAPIVEGLQWQVGVSAPGGQQLQLTETHTVGFSFTVGGEFGIGAGDIITAGLGFSTEATESIEDGSEEGVTSTCPDGPWYCSLLVIPSVVEFHGHLHLEQGNDEGCPVTPLNSLEHDNLMDNAEYVVQMPRKSAGGNPYSRVELCACQNHASWADAGAPSIVCPEPCA